MIGLKLSKVNFGFFLDINTLKIIFKDSDHKKYLYK